jgi:heat shock protein HtpX
MLAGFGSLLSYYWGALVIMGITDGRRVEQADDPLLYNVTSEMALAAGIPAPSIFIIPDPSPNAFATGRDPAHALVAVTTGLRTKLNRDELQAVIAHEIAHIKNFDTRLMMLVAVYAGLVVWVSDLGMRIFLQSIRFSGGRRGATPRPPRAKGLGLPFYFILFAATLCLAWIAPFVSKLLQLAISRQREYLADAAAVQYCRNPAALIEALKKISLDPAPLICDNRALQHLYIINPNPKLRLRRPDWDSVWSTHPPLIERIKRLRALGGG